ncbi:mitofusin-1 isoform X3 [Fundulus heteroclitus]|uniref:mitofusin-1 isoform X3 n=1 Tax=Fundulus heteroclitus TaxID=8078 RepID=UPI00165C1193|nr:mitofusin-1 isoform X3 [Fundulus heteroclitus]
MEAEDPSPLHRFVVAKRSIGSIFDQLLEFVKNGSAFVDEAVHSEDLGPVAVEEQSLEMQSCGTKLSAIRDVLQRRHMKVAFFGRTSNGKSTVINAMLRDRVLPSGIGHTTNCFLSVEGTDGDEAYLTTEASAERRSISTVNQLAHALHMDPALDSGSLVRVFWPKSRCALLRDDLVLMDSPGTDVTLELDSWIDKFCLDADVFVLVGNAESTLMNTEKLFFHKVSERISKPNIFILHNRWDASVTEPDYIDQVRKQHTDRCVSFLSEELRVVGPGEAAGRIFFVSAKEVLSCRTQRAQGMPETGETGGALAEGFQDRLREFQQFERAFEEFISRSAVRTKFEQHTARARQITEAVRAVMDAINIASADRKICCLEEREEQRDRLDFVRGQMSRLSDSVRDRIRTLTHDVAAKKLVQHVEERIVGCLAHRCSVGVLRDMQEAQRHMTDSVRPLVSLSVQQQLSAPSSSFQMTYDLTLPALCADFRENIDFRFSLGWTALVARFLGVTSAKRALGGGERGLQEGPAFRSEVMASIATGLVSATSRASMALLLIGGVVSPTTRRYTGVAFSGLACHRPLRLSVRSPLPVRETHLDGRQQGASPEAAVHGPRCPPPQSRRPRHQLRLQPAGVQGADGDLQPPDAEGGPERGRAGGKHPAADLQDPEPGEDPEEVQGLQEPGHGPGGSAGGLLCSVPAGRLKHERFCVLQRGPVWIHLPEARPEPEPEVRLTGTELFLLKSSGAGSGPGSTSQLVLRTSG